jgi:hypothetical protein
VAELWKKTRREFVAQFDGVSMRPTIEPQQPVNVRCGLEAHVGDVVMLVRDGSPVVHRLIWQSRNGDWLITQGDARTIPDPPAGRDDVTGIVEAPPHAARRMQRFAQGIVIAAAAFGRGAAYLAVRLMQIAAQVRARS